MRKINLGWLAGLIVVAFVVAGSMHLLHRYQVPRIAEGFLREARRAIDEDRPQDALRELRSYVSLQPTEVEGLALYGTLLAETGQFELANAVLEKALRLDSDRQETRRTLVELGMQSEHYLEARRNLEPLLKAFPEDGELWEWNGICQSSQSEFDKAQVSWTKAIELAPERLSPYGLLASLLEFKFKDTPQAAATIDQMVANNPDDPEAYLKRAAWRMRLVNAVVGGGETSAAGADLWEPVTSDLQRARALAPESADMLAFTIRLAIAQRALDEARSLISEGLALHPADARFYLALADIEVATSNPEAGLGALQRGISAMPTNRDLQWNIANSLIELGQDIEAAAAVEQLRISGHPTGMVGFLEARIMMQQGRWLEAIHRFETIRPLLQEHLSLVQRADFLLGKAYGEIDARDQQLTCFRRAITLDPQWMPARMGLAETLAATNFARQAAEEYRRILSLPGAPADAGLGLARCLHRLAARQPKGTRDWNEFDQCLLQFERDNPDSVQAPILRAEKSITEGDIDAARQLITAARQRHPDEIDLWMTQIAIAQLTQDWPAVEKTLREAEDHFGDQVLLRMVKGEYFVRRFGAEARERLKSISMPLASWTARDRFLLLNKLTRLYLMLDDYIEAERLGLMAASLQPGDLSIRLLLFDVGLRAQRSRLMKDVLQEVRNIAGDGPFWHYGEAVRLILAAQQGKHPENLQQANLHLVRAQAQRPTWSQIPLLKAEIEIQQGDESAATEHLLEAIAFGEQNPAVVNRTVALLFEQRRFIEADQILRRLLDRQQFMSSEMLRSASEIAIQLNDPTRALDMAIELARQTNSLNNRVWLAQVQGALGRTAEAEKTLRDILATETAAPEPWIALVQLFVHEKQLDKAAEVIAEAEQKIAPDQSALAAAQCYELIGQTAAAEARYKSALKQAPDNLVVVRRAVEFQLRNNRSGDAVALLRTILRAATRQNDRRWATRNLAMALAINGDRKALDEALTLIDQNLAAGPVMSADERVKAMILTRRPTIKERKQAIAILEKHVAHDPDAALEDRYLLGKLYLAIGDRSKARSEFRKLLALNSQDVRFISGYIQLILEGRELSEAELWLSRLETIAPETLLAQGFQAQLLFARERFDDLEGLLLNAVLKSTPADNSPDGRLQKMLWAAQRFGEFGLKLHEQQRPEPAQRFSAKAESLYQQYVAERPAAGLVLAEFYAQQKQIDRALDLLTAERPEADLPSIAAVSVAVMQSPATSAAQLDRLETHLQSVCQQQPGSISLKLLLADVMSWRGDFAQAARLYEEVLQIEPENIAALNNLALVLAMSGSDCNHALKLVQQAMDSGGDESSLLDSRGVIYLAAGAPEKALADFEQSLSEGESAERRFHLAVACAQLNQVNAAKRALTRAQEIGLAETMLHPLERPLLASTRRLLGS